MKPADSPVTPSAGSRSSRGAKDEILIAALASGHSHVEAAAAAAVSARTVRRRLESPSFVDQVDAERAVVVSRTTARLTGLTTQAVGALGELLAADVAPGVRLRAALGVLATAREWREHAELDERVAAIEANVALDAEDDS